MGKILEALFTGDLFVEPLTETRSREHQKACDTAYTLLEELSEKLNPEERTMLEHTVNDLDDENRHYTTDRFVRGYCLGALTMLEVLEKREDFFWNAKT